MDITFNIMYVLKHYKYFKKTKTTGTVQHQKTRMFLQVTQSSVTNKMAEIWQRLGILKGHYL